MKTPRYFIGLALLFWGWETGLLPWAMIMAAVMEAAPWVRARWELADSDLNRICDLCLVLFLGAGTLLYSTQDRLVFIFKWAQWMPFCFFPVALAQCYGDRPVLPLKAFSWLLRRIPQSPLARVTFNVSYGYYAICLLAASASTHPDQFFYLGVSLLILLALGSARPKRVSWRNWILLATLVVGCGKLSHRGIWLLQNRMESALGGWLADFFRSSSDAREVRTHIGRGPLSLSSRIVLRLRVPEGDLPPPLLREGAYDSYRRGTWLAGTNEFNAFPLNRNGAYQLMTPRKVYARVEIAGYYPGGDGLLPLPHGTFQIEDLPVGVLRTNRLGVADVQSAPGLVDFQADFWTGPSFDSPPGPFDQSVPDDEKQVLQEVDANLGLGQMTERQKIRAVSRFFQEHFFYSLDSPPPGGAHSQRSPLGRFLKDWRRGHCEYFATATVLLLREAGVSARYITGFAVPEAARHGDTYIVRERHRHAWALVYHSDTKNWEQIDNTPAEWAETAEASTPWWQGPSDLMSNLFFQFSRWRWGRASFSRYAQWALAPLILYLLWRILSTRRRQQNPGGEATAPAEPSWPGVDSELYEIDRRLASIHLSRQPNEPLDQWQRRLEEAFPASRALGGIFLMHRRLRFDPRGLPRHDRENLRRQAAEWLAELPSQVEQSRPSGNSGLSCSS